MKNVVLIFTCLLLMLLTPTIQSGVDRHVVGLAAADLTMDAVGLTTGMDSQDLCFNSELTDNSENTGHTLYNQDVLTLLTTYDNGQNDVIPFRMNQWGEQLRAFSSRMQFRQHSMILHVKRQTHLLSAYLSTLIHHISQFYSFLNSLCWQYAADCYVFALRQILI